MNNAQDILAALASSQPAAAVEKTQVELSARVESKISDFASNYQYVVNRAEPNDKD